MVADAPPPSRSDEDAWCAALVERVAAGEAQALEELYDRYARPAYSLALRVTGPGGGGTTAGARVAGRPGAGCL